MLTYDDLCIGFKRLSKKKKYKHPEGVFLRYKKRIKNNALANFIQETKKQEALKTIYDEMDSYSLKPFKALSIRKAKDKYRPLLIPEPKDRLIFDSLYPVVKNELIVTLKDRGLLGLGLQKNQNIEGLLYKIYNQYVLKGYTQVLTLDFSSFFSKINRSILFDKLKATLNDRNLYSVLKVIINNGIENAESVEEKTGIKLVGVGVPQGLAFSPLLACFYATDIDDEYMDEKDIVGFRYIDDILILAKTKEKLLKIHDKIKNLSKPLDIEIHKLPTKGKTEIIDLNENTVVFLGAEFSLNSATVPNEAFKKFLTTCQTEIFHPQIIEQKHPNKIKKVYFEYVKGWCNFYKGFYDDRASLLNRLNGLLYDYFNNRKGRLNFYKSNDWIKLDENKEPFIRRKIITN